MDQRYIYERVIWYHMAQECIDGARDESTINEPRRNLIKAGGIASAGALGSLAGCSNKNQGGDGSGGKESVTVDFWSGFAAETNSIKSYWNKGVKEFEKKQENVKVNLNPIGWDQLSQKYVTTMQGGANPPDLVSAGTYAMEFFQNGKVENLNSYMEGDKDLPEKWVPAMKSAGQFRGEWWGAGRHTAGSSIWTIRPKFFKEVGITNPEKELETWTQVRRALDKIKQRHSDVYPYEVMGAPNDVEAYWGNAYTAYKGGTDPWLDTTDKGSKKEPYIKPGKDPLTDGMIKNQIDLGKAYSSPQHPTRSNEDAIPMFLNDKIAVYPYGASTRAFKELNPEFSYGWENGDAYVIPTPKLDPNYGNEFSIPELAGKEGMHGGHVWGLEGQYTITSSSSKKVKDASWDLMKYVNTSKDFLLPLLIDPSLNRNIPAYQPIIDEIKKSKYDKHKDQGFTARLNMLDKYGENCLITGGSWGQANVSGIRWEAIGQTMSNAYANQISRDKTPSKMGENIKQKLEN